jgi:hypothetical protein
MIAASQESEPNLLDDPEYRLMAEALSDMGAYSVIFSDWAMDVQDGEYMEHVNAVYGAQRDEEITGDDMVAAAGQLLTPYRIYAIGIGQDNEGPFVVILILYDDPEQASADVDAFLQQTDSGVSVWTGTSWRDMIDSLEVWTEDKSLRAKLRGDIASIWPDIVHRPDTLLLCGGNEQATVTSTVIDDEVEAVFEAVVELRDLPAQGDVEYRLLSAEEMRDEVTRLFEEEQTREVSQVQQEVYVLLGMMDRGDDLHDILLEVHSEQVVGLYDTDADVMLAVLQADGSMGPLEKATIAHEYVHALQDQSFDLDLLLEHAEGVGSDAVTALQAVVEGEALLIMTFYMLTKFDASEIAEVAEQSEQTESEALLSAPVFIRESLTFPYEGGASFIVYLAEQLGGYEAVFQDLPRSTEQILHPEKYVDRDEPQPVELPDLATVLGGSWSEQYSDVFGEFGLGVMLETTLKDATGRQLLVMLSTWDDEPSALRFWGGADAFLKEIESQSRHLFVDVDGQDVLIIIGPDESTIEQVRAEFPGF